MSKTQFQIGGATLQFSFNDEVTADLIRQSEDHIESMRILVKEIADESALKILSEIISASQKLCEARLRFCLSNGLHT